MMLFSLFVSIYEFLGDIDQCQRASIVGIVLSRAGRYQHNLELNAMFFSKLPFFLSFHGVTVFRFRMHGLGQSLYVHI